MRSESADFLQKHPIANHVLSVIARRARREPHPHNGLMAGQCYMGDYLTIGISRQQYRTAISNLQTWGFVTINPTTKGTVVTLANTDVYDINIDDQPTTQPAINQQPNQEPTNGQPSTQPLTKNKELKNVRIKKKNIFSDADLRSAQVMFDKLSERYPGMKEPNLETWANDLRLMRKVDKRQPQDIADVFNWVIDHEFWSRNVLSTSKLRKQFDRLLIEMKDEKPGGFKSAFN
jgi:hypothetical protein